MAALPHRRSIRLPGYDYSTSGFYFVTICTYGRKWTLGEIVDHQVVLAPLGEVVYEEWWKAGLIRPDLAVDEFIVMPNHLHGLVQFGCENAAKGDRQGARNAPLPRASSLGSLVAGYKASVTRRATDDLGLRHRVWQRNYYERVIRNERQLAAVREYIVGNPRNWSHDPLNADPTNMR